MKSCIFFLIFSITLLTSSCRDRDLRSAVRPEKSMQSEQLVKIGRDTGLVLPAESKLIQFSEPERLIDPVWVTKIVMSPDAYRMFEQSLLGKKADDTIYHGPLADSTTWWSPTHVVLTRQYLANQHTFVRVVVSGEGDEFTVYIECAVF